MTDLKFGRGPSAMNAITFGTATRKRPGLAPDESRPDKSLDAAWLVLEAANDLGDNATVEACRRVIDANLNGTPAFQSDLQLIFDYFR
jgi:hypothetical protein